MLDLKRRGAVAKDWMRRHRRPLVIGLAIVAISLWGWFAWQEVQDVILSDLFAFLLLSAVGILIFSVIRSYPRELFVAVVGMVVGAIAGFVPYFVIGIFLLLLGLSPGGQSSYEELNELFNNEVFNQLFFVAGAASGGPIAIFVYFERRKERAAEGREGR